MSLDTIQSLSAFHYYIIPYYTIINEFKALDRILNDLTNHAQALITPPSDVTTQEQIEDTPQEQVEDTAQEQVEDTPQVPLEASVSNLDQI